MPPLVCDGGADFAPEEPPPDGAELPAVVRLPEPVGVPDVGVPDAGVPAACDGDGAAGAPAGAFKEAAVELAFTGSSAAAGPMARAGARGTGTSCARSTAALLSATGIAMPAAAAGKLGGNRSPGELAGLSARPITKQKANTATPASAEIAVARTRMPATPTPVGSVGIRKLLMTGRLSARLQPG